MQVFPISEDDAQPGWGQETPQPGLLPGSSFNASDLDSLSHLETALDSPPTPAFSLGANSFQTLRGAVLALDSPSNTTSVLVHPSAVEDTGALPAVTALPRGTFSLRGHLFHAFVSYRVTTEGGGGNGLSGLVVEEIRALSTDRAQELQIPQHGDSSLGPFLLVAAAPFFFCRISANIKLNPACDVELPRHVIPMSICRMGNLAKFRETEGAVSAGRGQGARPTLNSLQPESRTPSALSG